MGNYSFDFNNENDELVIKANLNWDIPRTLDLMFKSIFNDEVYKPDLDIGCIYITKEGHKGIIYSKKGFPGNKNYYPYIFLDKDDTTGTSVDGENIYLFRINIIEKILFFASLFKGAKNFKSVNARSSISFGESESFQISLDGEESYKKVCSSFLLRGNNGSYELSEENRYFTSFKAMDDYYELGFNWVGYER